MVNLEQFCEKEGLRYYLTKPVSRGEHTYATNGHILVRVVRRDEYGENDKFPNTDQVLRHYRDGKFITPPKDIKIPPNTGASIECDSCEGTGKEHECPSCKRVCDDCEGTGKVEVEKVIEVRVGASVFDGKYIRMVLAIDGVEIDPPTKAEDMLCFRFPGGIGMLMARRGQKENVCLIPAMVTRP